MERNSLPGIIAIAYIDCGNLSYNIEERFLAGLRVSVYGNMTQVSFSGMPTCVNESTYDKHSQSEKTTLTFQSVENLPIRQNLAFVITDVQEQSYLIGHAEDPYPTIKRERNLGTPTDEKAVYTYEVVLIGRKTLIPVQV